METIYPIIKKIKAGWSAKGKGWAVHAKTKEEAIQKYKEREKYYTWLDTQPFVYELAQQALNNKYKEKAHFS